MSRLRSPWLTRFLPGLLLGLAIGWAYGEWVSRVSRASHHVLDGMVLPNELALMADVEAALDADRPDLARLAARNQARTTHLRISKQRCYQRAFEEGFMYWPPSSQIELTCMKEALAEERQDFGDWRNPMMDLARKRLEERIAREAQQGD